jgi:hypothetical protein
MSRSGAVATKVVSKIFRTGVAIYTAVVVARSTGPNRPNCEFRSAATFCGDCVKTCEDVAPELWREQTWLLHHDNAPSHTFVLTQQFLAKDEMDVIPHPLYSPGLAPSDFFLFPKMKLKLKGRRFDTIEESRH